MIRAVLFSLFLLVAAAPAFAQQEQITDFNSHVTIQPDSTADVTETISVIATGDRIKHGIYRDFPTNYRDRMGNNVNVGFHVTRVMRDGADILYSVVPQSNGQRVYLGDANIPIEPGPHTFSLSYTADRELGYFKDYDEFYWNVTGNGWIFPIEQSEATIDLPQNAKVISQYGYTGYQGQAGRDYTVTASRDGEISFATTRGLNSNEGFTIAVAWPKGLVAEPTQKNKIFYFIMDYGATAVSAAALVLLLLYYLIVWRIVKATEPYETIIPLFTPPKDLPVSAVSFVYNKGADKKTLPATIINLAAQGCVKITQEKHFVGNKYFIQKVAPIPAQPEIEKTVADQLFSASDLFEFDKANAQTLQGVTTVLKGELNDEYEYPYFTDNYKYISIGGSFTGVAAYAAFVLSHLTVMPLPALLIGTMALLNFIFIHPIKSYTKEGKDLQAAIEGFKMFLSVADKYRFEQMNPPDVTPELFEKYFPYAVALGVENHWAEKFSLALAAAAATGQVIQPYQPRWYYGHSPFNPRSFAADLGHDFSSVIASSSVPPGSSSGSFGGGFSGGGGGGGGGGGF